MKGLPDYDITSILHSSGGNTSNRGTAKPYHSSKLIRINTEESADLPGKVLISGAMNSSSDYSIPYDLWVDKYHAERKWQAVAGVELR